MKIRFDREIEHEGSEWPLTVNSGNVTRNVTVDEYFRMYLKDTRSVQLALVPSTYSYVNRLTFDWEITELTKNSMTIQIMFDDPILISSSFDADRLQVSFHNTDQWLFTEKGFSTPNGYFLQHNLPP